jgi:hypothetical protein
MINKNYFLTIKFQFFMIHLYKLPIENQDKKPSKVLQK